MFSRPSNKIKGPNTCRNYVFEQAKGELIYFFDSDDLLKPNALETYLSNFDSKADAVIARLEKAEDISGKLLSENTIKSENLIIDYFKGNVSFYVCGPMWKKSFLDKQTQLFDEKITNLDDFDFNLRMIYANPKIIFLNEILITYYQHPDSLKKELLKLNKNEIDSAFKARYKHLNLLKNNMLANETEVEKIIIDHRKEILRLALLKTDPIVFETLKHILKYQLKKADIFGILKIITGVVVFSIFKRGYFLLK